MENSYEAMETLLWKVFLGEEQPDTSREIERVARLDPNEINLKQYQIPEDPLQALNKFEKEVKRYNA